MEPAIAELKVIANLIRGLAFAVDDTTFGWDSLRFVSDCLIDLANDLELSARGAPDQPIAEDGEYEAAKAEPDPTGDGKQAGALWDLLVSWAKQLRRQAFAWFA